MSDTKLSDYMTLADAAQRIKVAGLTMTAAGLWRWCRHGSRGIRLEHTRFAGRIVVTEADVVTFLERIKEAESEDTKRGRHIGSPRKSVREKQLAATSARLKARGI